MSLSGNPVMKKTSGTVLGLIGRRLPEFFFHEIVWLGPNLTWGTIKVRYVT
jgi:hypothetical protein